MRCPINERLLRPGRAGLLTLDEAIYIQSQLRENLSLRVLWGLRDKRLPLVRIAEKSYPEDLAAARQSIKKEIAKRSWRNAATKHREKHVRNENLTEIATKGGGVLCDEGFPSGQME